MFAERGKNVALWPVAFLLQRAIFYPSLTDNRHSERMVRLLITDRKSVYIIFLTIPKPGTFSGKFLTLSTGFSTG